MKRQFPAINRIIHKGQIERTNEILMNRIARLKFSNFTSFNNNKQTKSLAKLTNLQQSSQRIPSQLISRRAKTVMNHNHIKQQNCQIPDKSSSQRPSYSHKNLTLQGQMPEPSQKNTKMYPVRESRRTRCNKNSIFERSRTLGQLNQLQEGLNNIKVQIKTQISSIKQIKIVQILLKIQQEKKRQYIINLWNQVIQLHHVWYSIKFHRFKDHYQISVSPYPQQSILYNVKIPQQVGTNLFTQNDYDYSYISTHFIKETHQVFCVIFQLNNGPEKKRHCYKFQKIYLSDSERNKVAPLNMHEYHKDMGTKFIQQGVSKQIKQIQLKTAQQHHKIRKTQ